MKIASYAADSRVVNSVRNSVGNIRAHYDISNRMFASFLSKDVSHRMGSRGINGKFTLIVYDPTR